MPVELSLELMTTIRSYRMNPEGKLLYHIIDEVNSVLLVMTPINFQSPDPCGIVDSSVLEATDLSPVISPQR